jgi:hypothetical protein
MNVCQHNTKLAECGDICIRCIGLQNSKHLEFVVHIEFVLFHLSTPTLPCFVGAKRQKEHRSWITLQIQLHTHASLFRQCDQVSSCTKHFWCKHEFEHCHLM